MDRLILRRLVFKTVMLSSLILGALGLVGTVLFSLLVMYPPLFISIAFLGNALYGTVFYYIGYSNADASVRALAEIERGERKIDALAKIMHRTESAAETLILSMVKRGHLTGFVITDGELCVATQNQEQTNENIGGEN